MTNKVNNYAKTGYVTKSGTVASPEGRLSYASYLTTRNPEAINKKTGEGKYTCSLLIPPDADLSLLKAAADKAAKEFFGANPPKGLHSPFLDAGEKAGEEREGWTLLRVSSNQKPQIVDARNQNVDDADEVYSGRWAHLTLRAAGWDVDKKKGVSFFLSNVQLLRHDEPLGGMRAKAEDEFAPADSTEGGDSAGGLFD